MMVRVYRNLFLGQSFFLLLALIVVGYLASFFWPLLYIPCTVALSLLIAATLLDGLLLFRQVDPFEGQRDFPEYLTLGDQASVALDLLNRSSLPLRVEVKEELPVQLQERQFSHQQFLYPGKRYTVPYTVHPKTRGAYHFGKTRIFATSQLGFVQRRITLDTEITLKVLPSILQMKAYELQAFARTGSVGIKRMRRIGHSYEFEQIKNYVPGDDYRSINWKATGRYNDLMVNQYEDERSQNVYSIIDKSRSMHLPFEGMSLMDYAINTSLVISNIILKKHDKAGLMLFDNKMGKHIPAERHRNQLRHILNTLYDQEGTQLEANYEALYYHIKKNIQHRSLLLLFSNFESIYTLERVLPILRLIHRKHLLVLVFFVNTELERFVEKEQKTMRDIYEVAIGKSMLLEKEKIVQTLGQFGIQTILTRPDELSLHTVNKYLELKARGMI